MSHAPRQCGAARTCRCLGRAADSAILVRARRLLLVLPFFLLAAPAAAQTGEGRVELGGGARWIGGIPFNRIDAAETSAGGGRLTLFASDTELDASPGVQAHIGVRLTSVLQVEGGVAYNSTNLTTRISSDVEGIPDVSVSSAVGQYLVEAGLTATLSRWRTGRFAPFASAGAGYLRQLHEGRTLIETGRSYYAGGGVTLLLTSGGGRLKATGLRVDVRATFLQDGVAIEDGTQTVPSVGASLFVRF
jgi:hypothetical protein